MGIERLVKWFEAGHYNVFSQQDSLAKAKEVNSRDYHRQDTPQTGFVSGYAYSMAYIT